MQYISKRKDENHIISIVTEKAFNKMQFSFMIKILNIFSIERIPQYNKDLMCQILSWHTNQWKVESFSTRIRNKTSVLILTIPSNSTGRPTWIIRQDKERKCTFLRVRGLRRNCGEFLQLWGTDREPRQEKGLESVEEKQINSVPKTRESGLTC